MKLNLVCFVVAAFSHVVVARVTPKPDFYYMPPSPPCRTVMMTASVLKVDMNMKLTDLLKGEQLTPEFIKINPQHTLPTLTHNGLMLSESRAIAAYLANTRAAGEKIYPKDPKRRAMVDQMLYFDMGKVYQRFIDLYGPMVMGGAPYDEEKGKKLNDAMDMLEMYLTKNKWAAGNSMTIADISLLSSVSTIEAVGYDITKYPKIVAWYENSKKMIPNYQTVNQDGADIWNMLMENYKKDHPMK